MKEMAEAASKVVEEGKIKISPENAREFHDRWLSKVNDWIYFSSNLVRDASILVIISSNCSFM